MSANLNRGARTLACRVETFSTPIFFFERFSAEKRRYLQMIQHRRRLPHVYPDSARPLRTIRICGNGNHACADPSSRGFQPATQVIKRPTARAAKKLLGRTGESFWQKESYDHSVREQAEFKRIKVYIENNPVKAGLVKVPEQYPWSSASVEKSLDAARKSACATP